MLRWQTHTQPIQWPCVTLRGAISYDALMTHHPRTIVDRYLALNKDIVFRYACVRTLGDPPITLFILCVLASAEAAIWPQPSLAPQYPDIPQVDPSPYHLPALLSNALSTLAFAFDE